VLTRRARVFRVTGADAGPVLSGPLLLGLYLALAATWHSLGLVGRAASVLALTVAFFVELYGYHYQAHTPYLASERANRALEIVYSACNGLPFSLYAYLHLLHHEPAYLARKRAEYRSFVVHAGLATPIPYLNHGDAFQLKWLLWLRWAWTFSRVAARSPSSALTASARYHWHRRKNDPPLAYEQRSVLEPPREIAEWLWLAAHRGHLRQVVLEALAITGVRVAMCALDWRFFCFTFVPLFFALGVVRAYTCFADHVGVDLDDVERSAVSCYARSFNLVTFNNGYHLEHHRYQSVHWRELPRYRARLVPEEERAVAWLSQWTSPWTSSPRSARAPGEEHRS